MRRIIYIAGITGAGKTTAGIELGAFLGIPVISIDKAFDIIGERIGYLRPDELVWPTNLKKFKNGNDLKKLAYAALIPSEGDCILEGFPLGFKDDREMISEIIGDHEKVFFYLNPTFDQWKIQMHGKGKLLADTALTHAWETWQAAFQAPDEYHEIPDKKWLLVSDERYQREGLTDIKWDQMSIDKDLSGKTVIDLGCNEGLIGKYCIERGASAVVGIDKNWRYLQEALASGYSKGFLADLNELTNFMIPRFDIVFCLGVLHYVEKKADFIRFLAFITKDDGECIVEIPISQCIKPNVENVEALEFYNSCLIPTMPLMMKWLTAAFEKVNVIGPCVTPDGNASTRYIFKCKKRRD